jgi:hypothetical protein
MGRAGLKPAPTVNLERFSFRSLIFFVFNRSRSVPLCIHDAEETERLIVRIVEPVGGIGTDIEDIEKFHFSVPVVQSRLPFAPYADNHMHMVMRFVAAEPPGTQFKIPYVKFRGFMLRSDQHLPDNIRPVITVRLVFLNPDAPPSESVPKGVQDIAARDLSDRRRRDITG